MFNSSLEDTFIIYGTSHIISVVVVSLAILMVYTFREKLQDKRYYNVTRYTLGILVVSQELSLSVYRVWAGEWTLSTSLPLHLCGLAMIMSSIVLFTENKKVFLYSFFVMMIGASLAILTPSIDGNLGFPHYRFFQFFFGHGLILVNFTFILFVMGYVDDVKYKHLLNNLITLICLALFNLLVNILVDGNYMYLMGKPGPDTAFDLFGKHPYYLFNILIFGIPLFFHLFYLPFYIRNRLLRKSDNKKKIFV